MKLCSRHDPQSCLDICYKGGFYALTVENEDLKAELAMVKGALNDMADAVEDRRICMEDVALIDGICEKWRNIKQESKEVG